MPHDECTFRGFDLKKAWQEQEHIKSIPNLGSNKIGKQAVASIEPDFASVKQFTRLTMVFTSATQIHQMINMTAKPADKCTAILNSYDLIALRTDQEALADQAFTKSDADIISLDLS
mgnify:CR=1 FL=1